MGRIHPPVRPGMMSSRLTVCFYCADQNPHRDRSLGITSYTRGLLTHLQRRPGISLSAVTSKSSFQLPNGVREEKLPFCTDAAPGRLIADHLHPFASSSRAALWHYPKGFLPMPSSPRAPIVCTVHDTILQHYADKYPETRSRLAFAYWLHLLRRSIARCDVVLTVSDFSRTAILEFCIRYRITAPPVYVTYQGINWSAPDRAAVKGDYVLHLASALPHKRTRWLCDAWRQLQSAGAQLPRLLLVGSLAPELAAQVSQMRGVEFRAVVSRDELTGILARARALLLPSEIEGFGLPAVEAYAAGTPVVYVKATAVEEVLGAGSPGGFDLSSESFAAALDEATSTTQQAIEEKAAELAEKFSWEHTVERTIAAYRTVVD